MNTFVLNIVVPIRDWVKTYVSLHSTDSRVDDIIEKIPTQASSENKLADKAFVNSSVLTATANFRGSWATWNDVPTNSQYYPEDYAGNRIPTSNDYLVVAECSDYQGAKVTGTILFDGNGWLSGLITFTDENGATYTGTSSWFDGRTIGHTSFFGSNGIWMNNSEYDVLIDNVLYKKGTNIKIVAGGYTTITNSQIIYLYNTGSLTGTWRFKYPGNWEANGKTGWMPEYLVNEEPLTATLIAALNSGATEDIINNIPTKTSQLTNDSGFLTSHQSLTNYLNKTSTANNIILGIIQVGDANSTKGNAFTHIRKQMSGYASVTGFNVNGAAFAVSSDGTASFQHKTYNNTGGDAKNDSVLRFSKATGLQFAKNSTTTSMPVEEDYKEVAMKEDIPSLDGYATLLWVLELLLDGTDIKY